mmetsp:Transcript_25506/g.64293  ORF Transcript_25506/g.64293 Transcript_25506/m.64293 type:complete len:248 (+) Transcript_25506:848-1591(+)
MIDHLLVGDGSTPDAETEGQLVDEIRDVVDDVDHGLLVVGGGRAQQGQVVAQGVDGPANGDDEPHGVEGGQAGFVAASGSELASLAGEHFVDQREPAQHAGDESAEHGHDAGLAGPAAEEHEDGLGHEAVEQRRREVREHRLQNEVELNDLQRNGDQPVRVSVHRRGRLRLHPALTHEAVVPECNPGHKARDRDGRFPLFGHGGALREEEHGTREHGRARDPECHADDVVAAEDRVIVQALDDGNAG